MDNCILLNEQLDRLNHAAQDICISDIGLYIPIVKNKRSDLVKSMYADLLQQTRYKNAVEFLADDLLGGKNLVKRGSDLKKAKTAMTKMLPDALIGTVARSVEFTAVTLEIELAVARKLHAICKPDEVISEDDFFYAIRSAVEINSLAEQSNLVLIIGKEIENVVNMPFMSAALKMCRRPARLMGLGDLQDFLEKGFKAFKVMRGSQEFLSTFEERELDLIKKLYATD